MMSIFDETKKLRRFVRTDTVECSPGFVGPIAGEAESGQKFAVKLHRSLKIFHPQINVIENSCFHLSRISLTSSLSLREEEEDAEWQVRVIYIFAFRGESSTSIPTTFHRPRRLLCLPIRAAGRLRERRL